MFNFLKKKPELEPEPLPSVEKKYSIADDIRKTSMETRQKLIEEFKLGDGLGIVVECRKAAAQGGIKICVPKSKYEFWKIKSLESNGFHVFNYENKEDYVIYWGIVSFYSGIKYMVTD
jgi:hypothetical protein